MDRIKVEREKIGCFFHLSTTTIAHKCVRISEVGSIVSLLVSTLASSFMTVAPVLTVSQYNLTHSELISHLFTN